jgi:hypothetical protein
MKSVLVLVLVRGHGTNRMERTWIVGGRKPEELSWSVPRNFGLIGQDPSFLRDHG